MEFVLYVKDAALKSIRNCIAEFGEELEVLEMKGDAKKPCFKVHIHTELPTVIFDTCGQFGRLASIKINNADECIL